VTVLTHTIRRQRLCRVALTTTLFGVMIDSATRASDACAQSSDTVVKQAGPPLHRGPASLVSEVRIGVVDGAEEYMFAGSVEIAVGRDGSIYVYDDRAGALRKYDASGKFVAKFGRKGQGPGEYQQANGLGVMPDGRVVLRDPRNQRINVYSPSGEPVDHWALPSNANSFGSRMLTVDTAGIVYVAASPGGSSPSASSSRVTIRLSAQGRIIDTVRAPVFADELPQLTASMTRTTGSGVKRLPSTTSQRTPVPFNPTGEWTWSPLGYMVTGFSNRYAVDLRIPRGAAPLTWRQGDPVISVRRTVAPVPVPEGERAQRRELVERALRNVDPGWRWSGPDIPRTKPAYREILTGADGRIWVSLSAPSVSRTVNGRTSWSQPLVFDVFEPDGRYIGQVPIPAGTAPQVMRGDYLWASATDADGVPRVHRFRITWPAAGG
jgi:hypothetical protein